MKTFLIMLFMLWGHIALAGPWKVNKDHSEILFKVPYLTVSELTGRFSDFKGSVELNKDGQPVLINLTIVSSSIDTGHRMRDNHLRANDFLGTKGHPDITFNSNKIQKMGGLFKATGPLIIKNKSKTVSIDFKMTDSITDTWGHENKFVKFSSKLNRSDFNINWNKTIDGDKYLVGTDIDFWGVFQLQPVLAATPSSKHMIPDTKYIRQREIQTREQNKESALSKKLRGLINGK
jgi:polyisoprenoid-binding protein YceI